MDTNTTTPNTHPTPYPGSCRKCGDAWPCDDSSGWSGGHLPARIPVGAVVTTYEDLDRLISWAPGGNCPVVLDRHSTPWIIFANEDGDGFASTAECPDEGIPGLYPLDELPLRGPLHVLFNGDRESLPGRTMSAEVTR